MNASFYENLTNPSGLAVDLSDLKDWLRICDADEDPLLTSLLLAAQNKIGSYLNYTMLPHDVRGNFSHLEISKFEKYPHISFKKSPFDTIIQVAYWNGTAFIALVDGTDYVIEERSSGFMRVLFKDTSKLNTLSVADDIAYPIVIDATVGSTTLPEEIKLGILQYAALLFDNRGDCSDCTCDSDGSLSIPALTRTLISPYKIRETFG